MRNNIRKQFLSLIILTSAGVLGTLFLTSHVTYPRIRADGNILTVGNNNELTMKPVMTFTNVSETIVSSLKPYSILGFSFMNEPFIVPGIRTDRPFRRCKYRNCLFTKAISFYNISFPSFDVVILSVFYSGDLAEQLVKISRERPMGQLWIAFFHEPIIKVRNFHMYNNVFNATMSYLHQSDVVSTYGHYYSVDRWAGQIYPENKTKQVFWYASNCNAPSQRQTYVDELKKHIQVDIGGNCATTNDTTPIIESSYRYYLAFENSICEDYLTEKVWQKLGNYLPIILGGGSSANLARRLPPDSYLDVRNFSSPKHLAEYLLELSRDRTKYNRYFDWRKKFSASYHWVFHYCDLCEWLNTGVRRPVESFSRVDQWPSQQCHDGGEFMKSVGINKKI